MPKKRINLGILAHVDTGKTTLSEALLYLSGSIRKAGRVDHRDTFLDTDPVERDRGITVFSKQAELTFGDTNITLLDTPGHVDFSAETERTLQVLDYAVLMISASDGVQSHTRTLWKLLKHYNVPVFIFVNKIDRPDTDREKLLADIKKNLSDGCIDFSQIDSAEFFEEAAMCSEKLMEEYLETGCIGGALICDAIAERSIFPCLFGSALMNEGVSELLSCISRFSKEKNYPEEFGARVFKITRDRQGNRLTHLKITGGSLKVKTVISSKDKNGEEFSEKVEQIRIYSGVNFSSEQEIKAGRICSVTGLDGTFAGQGLGIESDGTKPVLEPIMQYRIILPEGADPHTAIRQFRMLEEEDPTLRIEWNSSLGTIHAKVMGEIEIEVLKMKIFERFGTQVEFGSGGIVYKETVAEKTTGVGHFEPLRHYAEVHLLIEPLPRGSGLQFESAVSTDVLALNWQRLILTHLAEKKHLGVLTGSELADVKITLTAGRAHLKHTEGGDFRQATYRAVRQGLRKAASVLLEPIYEFTLEVPVSLTGRALTDIEKMHGRANAPVLENDICTITGFAPASEMHGYQSDVMAYTKGTGQLSYYLYGYEPCHNAEKVIEETAYDPEHDLENPTGSVFCSHGAGFPVAWNEVDSFKHIKDR